MFDPITSAFLRRAPELPGLDPDELPGRLTAHFADLVARRLRVAEGDEAPAETDAEWPLTRIADAYELITSLHEDDATRRAAAFVAGTAQQILAQEKAAVGTQPGPILGRDFVDPSLSAAVLFLAAEQFADANEAAQRVRIVRGQQGYPETLLAESVRDLAAGRFESILARAARRPEHFLTRRRLEARSLTALLEALIVGTEMFAAEVMGASVPANAVGRFDSAGTAFARVHSLSSHQSATTDPKFQTLLTTYPGCRHLAALLLAAYDATAGAATTKVPPPPGADAEFWDSWLKHRARSAPFIWQNHREALEREFHHNGKSAVVILPTGAGKTTVSCIKIANVLGSGRNVVFVAPTHALVEQLTTDLQEMFPEALLGSIISSDFDRLFAAGTSLRRIEVMTPEHCLALLSYAPDAFANVGLMVFDECHLLSPVSGFRRSLDGMFCVLAFNRIAPEADFLFLSAMIRNGNALASWLGTLTGRDCIFIDPLWKPSRQARGVVMYKKESVDQILRDALRTQRAEDSAKGPAKGLRKSANAKLLAEPYALFGLQHNWLHENTADCITAKLSEEKVQLGGALSFSRVLVKPNVNDVAAHIAASAARNGLKTIVFVNVKSHAISTARKIADALGTEIDSVADEDERWHALEVELGSIQHSLLAGPSVAVPHNAEMIRLERDLAERMFRRPDGAKVIVATPTLAQGLNLPAHLAILASDMRADENDGGRKPLGAHELLNAAARAGRAGHLANGVVLLIPEQVLTFSEGAPLDRNIVEKLRSVLPEDDRCLELSDPLELVLDRINMSAAIDADVEYALNRMSTVLASEDAEADASRRFSVKKSFAAYLAQEHGKSQDFEIKIEKLNELLSDRNKGTDDRVLMELAAQSGAPVSVLGALRDRLKEYRGDLPIDIPGWVSWTFDWLSADDNALTSLLERDRRRINQAVGMAANGRLSGDATRRLLPGVLAWLAGQPLRDIEAALGGDPNSDRQKRCPRARHLVTGIVPMGLTFVTGLVARSAKEVPEIANGMATPRYVIECLPAAVRRGFDTPSKLAFSEVRSGLFSRVQTHHLYMQEIDQEPAIDVADEYGTVVARMRDLLQ